MALIKEGKILRVIGFSLCGCGFFWISANIIFLHFFSLYFRKLSLMGPFCFFLGMGMAIFPGRGDRVHLEKLKEKDVYTALKQVPWGSYVLWGVFSIVGIVAAYFFRNFLNRI